MRGWLLLCALLSTAVQALTLQVQTLQVRDAWIRELPPGQTVSAGYFTLVNDGGAPVTLVAASSPSAGRVEMHSHRSNGDAVRMEQLSRVEVPAGETLPFRPGGLHLMLIDLKQPLRAGDTVAVTLLDEHGGEHPIALPVIDARKTDGGASAGHGDGHAHHHH